jgi:hypothetical protein
MAHRKYGSMRPRSQISIRESPAILTSAGSRFRNSNLFHTHCGLCCGREAICSVQLMEWKNVLNQLILLSCAVRAVGPDDSKISQALPLVINLKQVIFQLGAKLIIDYYSDEWFMHIWLFNPFNARMSPAHLQNIFHTNAAHAIFQIHLESRYVWSFQRGMQVRAGNVGYCS